MNFVATITGEIPYPKTKPTEADPNETDKYAILCPCDYYPNKTVCMGFYPTREEAEHDNMTFKGIIVERDMKYPIVRYWKDKTFGTVSCDYLPAHREPYSTNPSDIKEITYKQYIQILKKNLLNGTIQWSGAEEWLKTH